uniref:G-protein coupled receptors family 3 profile domain-containing protein n=1 Tax=Tetranychus urticae TaxID=32264 RepID=T1KXF8_TETUR
METVDSIQPTMRILWLTLLISLIGLIPINRINGNLDSDYGSYPMDECKPYSRPEPIAVIENDADIYLNALLSVHSSSQRGIYGCGPISRKGLIIFQALRWIISTINQDNGYINGKKVNQSLIPGVKLGMRVYDTCNHKDLGINYLTKIYSVLERGSDDCEDNSPIDLGSLTLIDMFGVTKEPRLMALARHYHLPINHLTSESLVTPEVIAKTLSLIVTDLKWTQIAIIHSSDEYSLQVIKLLGQSSLKDRFCLTMVQTLPKLIDGEPYNDSTKSSDSVAYIAVLRSVLSMVSEDVPIIILGSDLSVSRLIEVMSERISAINRHQWLFSTPPDPKLLAPFVNSSVSFFTLSPFPGIIDSFESAWSSALTNSFSSESSPWFDEYKATLNEQLVKKDLGRNNVDILWRTTQVLPVIQLLFIIGQSLREAWFNRCSGQPGLCPDLVKLTRKEFEADFMELRLDEGSGSRTRIVDNRLRGSVSGVTEEGIQLALTKLTFNNGRSTSPFASFSGSGSSSANSITYQHMISYDSAKGSSQLIDGSVSYRPSPCPPTGCERCLKVRQSRIIDGHHSGSRDIGLSRNEPPIVSSASELSSIPVTNSWTFEKRSDQPLSSSFNPIGSGLTSLRDQECLARCTYSWKYGHQKSASPSTDLKVTQPSTTDTIHFIPPGSGFSWETKLETIQLSGPWHLTLAIASALGVILIIVSGFYFILVFPISLGTTVLGYFTLFGLVAMYGVNFVYLSPISFTVCLIRRLGMSLAYTMVLSALLVKTMNIWRLKALRETGIEKLRLTTPSRLLLVSVFLLSLQVIVTLIWLIFIPPQPNVKHQACTWPPSQSLIQTESIVSLVYILILGSINILFALLSWTQSTSPHGSTVVVTSSPCSASSYTSSTPSASSLSASARESRWIAISCLLIAVVWSLWAAVVTYSPQLATVNGNLTIVVANLACATILLVCLYVRKISSYLSELSKSRLGEVGNMNSNLKPAPGSYYGTLPKAQKLSISLFGQSLINGSSQASSPSSSPSSSSSSSTSSTSIVATTIPATLSGLASVKSPSPTSQVNLSRGITSSSSSGSTLLRRSLSEDHESKGSSTLTSSTFLPSSRGNSKGDVTLDDAASSCASTSGSIQVQAEDLYPMEVYEGSNSLQQQYHYFAKS